MALQEMNSTNIVTRLLCQMPGSLNDALRTMVEAAEIIEQYRADAVHDEAVILKLKARIEALEAALKDAGGTT